MASKRPNTGPGYGDNVFEKRIATLEAQMQRMHSSKVLTAPMYDPSSFPSQGVNGQIALTTPTSSDPMAAYGYDETNGYWRIGGGLLTWIYIGTLGVDGVDELLETNPHPYQPGDTPGPQPFQNGYTNQGGGLPPVGWAINNVNSIFLNGAYTGDYDDDVIFTFPFTFGFPQFLHFPLTDFSDIHFALVNTDGTVVDKGDL